MKIVILAMMIAFTASPAHAADSTRLSCDNGHVQLNVFEYRSGADTRATDLTVVYGAYIFAGKLSEADGGLTVLSQLNAKASGNQFAGLINIDYSKSKVRVLSGEMILQGESLPVAPKFTCKELN